jgi:hypothetical protein
MGHFTTESLHHLEVYTNIVSLLLTFSKYLLLPEGTIPLGRPRRRWVDNIKMDLREIGWVVWIGLMWLRIRTSGGLL